MSSLHLTVGAAFATAVSLSTADHAVPSFEKRLLETHYWSEGAALGDLNADGHPDVVYGPYWWEGPDFTKRHEIYPPTRTFRMKMEDGSEEVFPGFPGAMSGRNAYSSDNFFAFVYDFDGDGWGDVLTFGMPNQPAYLYINPRTGGRHWERHVVFDHVDNESPTFADLTGDGKPELVCNSGGNFGYASPDWTNPTARWKFTPITENGDWQMFTHGLGIGDVNGDGRLDVLFKDGWLEQPASLDGNPVWKLHQVAFAPAGAQMYAYDVNGNGLADVITALDAHGFGLVWHEQLKERDEGGSPVFRKHIIMGQEPAENRYGVTFSEPHAMELVDMDGDGLKDIVVGKCFWSHGPNGAPDGVQPAVLYWFKLVRREGGTVDWIPHLIDDDSGVGRQIGIADVNGDGFPDIAIGNKKGGFVFINALGKTTAGAQHNPSGAAPPLRVVRDGLFFTAREHDSRYEVSVPIAPGARYARAAISFDVEAPAFPGLALHSIVEMVNPTPEGHRGRYFALQHTLLRAEERGVRTNIDNMVHGYSATRTDIMQKVRTGGASLRYRVVYDTREKSVTVEITDRDTGEVNAFTETRTNRDEVLVEEEDIHDAGHGLLIALGLDRTYDHGGYYPPYGWSFSNLSIELTR